MEGQGWLEHPRGSELLALGQKLLGRALTPQIHVSSHLGGLWDGWRWLLLLLLQWLLMLLLCKLLLLLHQKLILGLHLPLECLLELLLLCQLLPLVCQCLLQRGIIKHPSIEEACDIEHIASISRTPN